LIKNKIKKTKNTKLSEQLQNQTSKSSKRQNRHFLDLVRVLQYIKSGGVKLVYVKHNVIDTDSNKGISFVSNIVKCYLD
jgi:hypothetical protein